jgi:hypothetical protein
MADQRNYNRTLDIPAIGDPTHNRWANRTSMIDMTNRDDPSFVYGLRFFNTSGTT